ncbi:hypothetical protein Q7P37_000559 [Cladosporium fusiforme]
MDTRLQDRIAIITGASSGIGKATAIRFANSGARVVIADLQSTGVEEEIAKQHGKDSSIFIACNVCHETEIEALIKKTVQWAGRLDIIGNFAGIARETSYESRVRCHTMETKDFDLNMEVNCRGVWLCCKYALKQMMEQEPREPNARGDRTRGWIINAASIAGVVGHAGAPGYTASKHAVVGMTKQMALDYAQDRIHINSVNPGFVHTPMIAHYTSTQEMEDRLAGTHPWNALGRPEDIADAALFLASDEAAWVTGHTLVVDGGYTAQ